MASVQDFIGLVRRKGLARIEKFQVNIFGPRIGSTLDEKDISLLCEEASIPGLTIGTRTARLHNLNIQRPSTIDYGGENAMFTFLVDGSWDVRKYFDKWMKTIVNDNREVNEYVNIIGGVQIIALHEGPLVALEVKEGQAEYREHTRYSVFLEEAFPKSMSPLSVAYGNPGLLRFTVSFAYKSWRIG